MSYPVITALKGLTRTRFYIYRDGAFLGTVASSLDPAIEYIEERYHLQKDSVKEAVVREEEIIKRSRL